MGCGQSKISNSNVAESNARSRLVTSRIQALFKTQQQKSGFVISPYIHAIIASPMMIDELNTYLNHLETLSRNPSDKHLLRMQLQINHDLNQFWLLNKASLSFFTMLENKDIQQFNHLITWLQSAVNPNEQGLQIKAKHITSITAIFCADSTLLADALIQLQQHLSEHQLNSEQIISQIRSQQLLTLKHKARIYQFLHHDVPHALEVAERSMHILNDILKLYTPDKSDLYLLQQITHLFIMFHDFEQQTCFSTKHSQTQTTEQITALSVSNWLIEGFCLNTKPELQALIHLIANRLIVLGTTMIFGHKRSIDLSELYFKFREHAQTADIQYVDASNLDLINKLDTSLLVIGICDKTPAAFKAVVTRQARHPLTHSLLHLKTFFPASLTLQLESFLSKKACFTSTYQNILLDRQAFLIALIPHFSMSIERNIQAHPTECKFIITLIDKLRVILRNEFVLKELHIWLTNQFTQVALSQYLDTVFFNQFTEESNFSHHQLATLNFGNKALLKHQEASASPLISILAMEDDAANLTAFNLFYKALSTEDKCQLSTEILLLVATQAGVIYAKNFGVNLDLLSRNSRHRHYSLSSNSADIKSPSITTLIDLDSTNAGVTTQDKPSFFCTGTQASTGSTSSQKDIDDIQRLRY